jgi:hypothetical protein
MLLGNRNELAFEVTPLQATWERRYLPEREAWGALSVFVHGDNLARHVDAGSGQVDEAVNVPLLPLVNWLITSWTALAYEERPPGFTADLSPHDTLERWGVVSVPNGTNEDAWLESRQAWFLRHFLSAAAEETHLPSVGFVRQDDQLEISWRPARSAGVRSPAFIAGSGQTQVPWATARAAFEELVKLSASLTGDPEVASKYPWLRTDSPSLPEVEPRALEYFTGLSREMLLALADADNEAELIEWLGLDRESDPASSPVTQIIRDMSSPVTAALTELLGDIRDGTRRMTGGGWQDLRAVAIDAMRGGENPEEAGQLAAEAFRDVVGLDGHPLPDAVQMLRNLDVAVQDADVGPGTDRMVTGARVDGSAIVVVLRTHRTQTTWGSRFEQVRGLGHLLLDTPRDVSIGAASGPQSQPLRRRRSGAFAAEVLLPYSALLERTGGALDAGTDPALFGSILHDFGVGARTAAHQLYNHGLLSSPSRRDDVIDSWATTSP